MASHSHIASDDDQTEEDIEVSAITDADGTVRININLTLTLNIRGLASVGQNMGARVMRSVGVQGNPGMAMMRTAGGPRAHYISRDMHVIVPTAYRGQWAAEQAEMERQRYVNPNPTLFEDEPFYEPSHPSPQWRVRPNLNTAFNGNRPWRHWAGEPQGPSPEELVRELVDPEERGGPGMGTRTEESVEDRTAGPPSSPFEGTFPLINSGSVPPLPLEALHTFGNPWDTGKYDPLSVGSGFCNDNVGPTRVGTSRASARPTKRQKGEEDNTEE